MDKGTVDKIFLFIFCLVLVIIINTGRHKGTPSTITEDEHHKQLDSIKWELQRTLDDRTTLSHRIDSLVHVTDSLVSRSKKIDKELSNIRGKYNTLNSQELTDKMIQAYNAGQVN